MKKIVSILLTAALCLSLSVAALAEGFNAGLTVTRSDDGNTISVTVVDSRVLAEKKPKLTVPCEFDYATVKWNNVEIASTLRDGTITFVVAEGGTYVITKASAPWYDYYVPVVTPTTPAEPEKEPETEQPAAHPFVDVPDGEWYSDGVQYVYTNGIMKGTNETGTVFDLNGSTSRAMLMTMLARMSGVDTSVGNTWDEIGMNWAVAAGISDGTNGSAPITREQLVTMLYRYAGSPAVSESSLAALSRYSDYDALSNWAQYAMAWAVEKGIITHADGKLLPGGTASRAMVATVLMRFGEVVEN